MQSILNGRRGGVETTSDPTKRKGKKKLEPLSIPTVAARRRERKNRAHSVGMLRRRRRGGGSRHPVREGEEKKRKKHSKNHEEDSHRAIICRKGILTSSNDCGKGKLDLTTPLDPQGGGEKKSKRLPSGYEEEGKCLSLTPRKGGFSTPQQHIGAKGKKNKAGR